MKDTVAALLGEALQTVISEQGADITPPPYRSSARAIRPRRPGQQRRPRQRQSPGHAAPRAGRGAVRGTAENSAIARTEIAGPGFINFFLSRDSQGEVLREVLAAGRRFGHSSEGAGRQGAGGVRLRQPHGPAARRPRARRRGRRQPGAHPRSQRLGASPASSTTTTPARADQQPRPVRAGALPRPHGPGTTRWPEDGYRGAYIARWPRPTSPATASRPATSP
jgi:arginyl-tRNA synthetase